MAGFALTPEGSLPKLYQCQTVLSTDEVTRSAARRVGSKLHLQRYPSLKLLLVMIPKWDWAPGTKLELKIAEASGVSAKPAMRGHFKTGHVRRPGT